MEIVSIEKKTFEMMVASFNALAEKVAALRRRSDGGRMERWLTGRGGLRAVEDQPAHVADFA
jgi:hypothetical protein